MTLRVTNLVGFGAGRSSDLFSLVATGSGSGSDNTVSDVEFGLPHTNRYIIVVVAARALGSTTFSYDSSADQINGGTATTHTTAVTGSNGNNAIAACFSAAVPTGETGSIRFKFSRSAPWDYAVYRLVTSSFSVTDTASDVDGNNGVLNDGADLDLNANAGDALVAGAAVHGDSTWSVTGVANEAFSDERAWLGYERVASAGTPRTVDIDPSEDDAELVGVAVTFNISA